MTPTPEQLDDLAEALWKAVAARQRLPLAAWEFVAPIVRTHVLEEAASLCDRMDDVFAGTDFGAGISKGASYCADRIRALR